MSLAIAAPAPIGELADMLATEEIGLASLKFPLAPFRMAHAQISAGRSWGLWEGDRCIACYGAIPTATTGAPAAFEVWIMARRAPASRRMLEIIRLVQLTAAHLAHDAPVEFRARVASGHRPGERLARAIGFHHAGAHGGFGEWLWRVE